MQYAQPNLIYSSHIDDFVFGAVEDLGSRTLASSDLLSATVEWENGLTAPIVRGMAYVAAFYKYVVICTRLYCQGT